MFATQRIVLKFSALSIAIKGMRRMLIFFKVRATAWNEMFTQQNMAIK
jgi:hypothetical protein